MRDEELPARHEIFLNATGELGVAYRALGDATDWLHSDWWPVGSSLTSAQTDAKGIMFEAIGEAKAAINKAKDAADRAIQKELS